VKENTDERDCRAVSTGRGSVHQRVHEVPDAAWDNPAPCEGWDARDVVRHLVEWLPAFMDAAGGPPISVGPSVDDDPTGAWDALNTSVQSLLDDPVASAAEISHPQAGTHRLDDAVATFFLGDVVVHTWDLARAAGLDETLDPKLRTTCSSAWSPLDEMLRASGQYGPRVDVGADADEQTKLIAFTGRQPRTDTRRDTEWSTSSGGARVADLQLVDPTTNPYLSDASQRSIARSTPPSSKSWATSRDCGRVHPQRSEPEVLSARQLHVPDGGRRHAARASGSKTAKPGTRTASCARTASRRRSGRQGALRRDHDASVRRPVAARPRSRPGLPIKLDAFITIATGHLARAEEGAPAYEVSPELETIGRFDFAGGLAKGLTAPEASTRAPASSSCSATTSRRSSSPGRSWRPTAPWRTPKRRSTAGPQLHDP
jgi:uncharacterized protein (TIGR03086 family)